MSTSAVSFVNAMVWRWLWCALGFVHEALSQPMRFWLKTVTFTHWVWQDAGMQYLPGEPLGPQTNGKAESILWLVARIEEVAADTGFRLDSRAMNEYEYAEEEGGAPEGTTDDGEPDEGNLTHRQALDSVRADAQRALEAQRTRDALKAARAEVKRLRSLGKGAPDEAVCQPEPQSASPTSPAPVAPAEPPLPAPEDPEKVVDDLLGDAAARHFSGKELGDFLRDL